MTTSEEMSKPLMHATNDVVSANCRRHGLNASRASRAAEGTPPEFRRQDGITRRRRKRIDYIKTRAAVSSLFIDGKFVAPQSGKYFDSINPATEEKLAEIAAGECGGCGSRGEGRAARVRRCLEQDAGARAGQVSLSHRAHHSGESRASWPCSKRWTAARPIKESRDVDLPLVAAHFFYYAGWADKLEYAFPGRNAAAARRRRADHSVEFSAAHGGVENRARARVRQHRRAQARRDHEHHRAAAGADFSGSGIARRRGEHRHRRGRNRRGARQSSGHRQDRVHRQRPRSASCIAQAVARHEEESCTLELGGKAANIIFEDAPIDQAVEGVIAGIYFNQGHVCCAGSRLFVQEGIYSDGHPQTARPHPDVARRRSARQKHRHRRDQFAAAARKNPRAGAKRRGRRRGADAVAAARCRRRATGFRRRFSPASRMRIASRRRKFSGRC